jgi:PAS domain S-box-containing protein
MTGNESVVGGGRPSVGAVHPPGLEAAWAELLKELPAAFYIDRVDGTSVWVSPKIEELTGCTREEWSSGYDVWASRIHPDDRERVLELNRQFLRTGGPEGVEYRVMLPDGTLRWVHERSAFGHEGKTGESLIHGVIVDVTPERLSREVAERVGRLFQTLVEHSGEAVTIVDQRGMVVYQNPTMGRVVGRPPEWFTGRSPLELMPPEDAERGRRILAALAGRPGAQLPGEFRLKHHDGSWKTVVGVATNLLHDPAVGGIVLNYRDVTEERRVALDLRAAERRRQALLEDAVRVQAEERSRIAKELDDDPIRLMSAALMELDRLDRHIQQSSIVSARASIANARQALAAAAERTRRLTFELRSQVLDGAGLSAAVRDLAGVLAAETGAEVDVHTQLGRYPPDIETLVYRTIRGALIDIRNQARATHVGIRVGTHEGAIVGEITDDGSRVAGDDGLSPNMQAGLDSTSERLHLEGATLEITSTPGNGTCVHFKIPLPPGPDPVGTDQAG